MPDFDDQDDEVTILNGVEDAVVTLANPVEVVTRELFRAGRSGVRAQFLEPGDKASPVLARQRFEFLDR
jgi:hypothetical protein